MLETLDKEIKRLEDAIKSYELCIYDLNNSKSIKRNTSYRRYKIDKAKDYLESDIKLAEEQLKALRVKRDVEIIKPYLEEKGVRFDLTKPSDHIDYYFRRRNNIIHLTFVGYFENYSDGCYRNYNIYPGQIVYDTDGNVLIDYVADEGYHHSIERNDNTDSNNYREVDPSDVFLDDENILIHQDNISYVHYKLVDGKWISVNKFERDENGKAPFINRLDTADGQIMLDCNGKLYSVSESMYLNKIRFSGLTDYEKAHFPDTDSVDRTDGFSESTSKLFSKIMKENNLLVGYTTIPVKYTELGIKDPIELKDEIRAFVFLNTNGDIVSKMYYSIDNVLYSIPVSNNTYKRGIEKVRQAGTSNLEKKVFAKRASIRKELIDKMNKENNLLISLEKEVTTVPEQMKKKTYKPRQKKEDN